MLTRLIAVLIGTVLPDHIQLSLVVAVVRRDRFHGVG